MPPSQRQDPARDLELDVAVRAVAETNLEASSGARGSAPWRWLAPTRRESGAVGAASGATARTATSGWPVRRSPTADVDPAAEPDARQGRSGAALELRDDLAAGGGEPGPRSLAEHGGRDLRHDADAKRVRERAIEADACDQRHALHRTPEPVEIDDEQALAERRASVPRARRRRPRRRSLDRDLVDREGGRLARDRVGADGRGEDQQPGQDGSAGGSDPVELEASARALCSAYVAGTCPAAPGAPRRSIAPKRDDGRRRARPRARAGP